MAELIFIHHRKVLLLPSGVSKLEIVGSHEFFLRAFKRIFSALFQINHAPIECLSVCQSFPLFLFLFFPEEGISGMGGTGMKISRLASNDCRETL